MATPPPVAPSAGALDAPPAPSSGPTGATPSPGGSPVGGQPAGQGDPNAAKRALVTMGAEIDRAMTAVAQAINQMGGQDGLQEIAMARQAFEAGIAKALAAGGQAPSASPVETGGASFPGGGAVSGRIG